VERSGRPGRGQITPLAVLGIPQNRKTLIDRLANLLASADASMFRENQFQATAPITTRLP
jgi:hypothetical protein